jgi:small nuclear ribonucleoprotein (snRNP)-like protein
MAGNRVVARFRDGRVVKGTTTDFSPTRDVLHVQTGDGMVLVRHGELKALFFVRDLFGDPAHRKSNQFPVDRTLVGHPIRVEFLDGEVLVGTTVGYRPDRAGFFVAPADAAGNAERCYVIAAATRSVRME